MGFSISKELEDLRDEAREFVRTELEPFAAEVDRTHEVPEQVVTSLKERGYFGLAIPEKYGGKGIGKLGLSLVQIEIAQCHIAYVDLMGINNGLGSQSLVRAGTEKQKSTFLPRLAKGEMISAFTLTEPNAGSDATGIKTRAEKEGDLYRISGLKHFITNGPIADVFIVMAVTDPSLGARGGVTAFLVEKGTPGLSIGSIHDCMGLQGCHQSEVIFQNAEVPAENVIGEVGQGFGVALGSIDEGRMSVSAIAIGTAERLFELAMAKVKADQADPRAYESRQSQSAEWLLSDMAMEIHAAKVVLFDAAAKRDRGERVRLEAAMCKLFATEMVSRVVARSMEVLGPESLLRGSVAERMCRDARILRIWDGTSEIHRNVIARKLLKGERAN